MEKPVILIIADISGYTNFVTSNIETTAHSQTVIGELVETIIRQVEIPLEVAKLEGDAVFLYSVKENSDAMSWEEKRRKIGEKLVTFFDAFTKKVVALQMSTLCECDACRNIHLLRLKIIVHSGRTVFQKIGRFEELGGLDAIIVHRLLKNSVQSKEYILMTESGYEDIDFPSKIEVRKGREKYDDVGTFTTFVYYPPAAAAEHRHHLEEEYQSASFLKRYRAATRWGNTIWIRSFALIVGLKKPGQYRNLSGEYPLLPRLREALFLILTLPFFAFAKAYKSYVKMRRAEHPSSAAG